MTTPKTPQEIAADMGLPLQRALIDFDLHPRVKEIIGGHPQDLSEIDMTPVHSLTAPWAVVTIYSHTGEEQEVANLLEAKPGLKGMALAYGEEFIEKGVMDFAFHSHADPMTRSVLQTFGLQEETQQHPAQQQDEGRNKPCFPSQEYDQANAVLDADWHNESVPAPPYHPARLRSSQRRTEPKHSPTATPHHFHPLHKIVYTPGHAADLRTASRNPDPENSVR